VFSRIGYENRAEAKYSSDNEEKRRVRDRRIWIPNGVRTKGEWHILLGHGIQVKLKL